MSIDIKNRHENEALSSSIKIHVQLKTCFATVPGCFYWSTAYFFANKNIHHIVLTFGRNSVKRI